MTTKKAAYHSYLLRIWIEDGSWRAVLNDTLTNKQIVFTSGSDLVQYLNEVDANLNHPQRLPAS